LQSCYTGVSMHAARTLLRPLQTLAPAAARQMTVLPAMGGGKEHFCVETLTLNRKDFERIQGVPAGARKASVIVDAAMGGGKEHLSAPLVSRGVYGQGKIREGV